MLFTVLFLSRCSSRHFLVLFQFLHQVVFVIPVLFAALCLLLVLVAVFYLLQSFVHVFLSPSVFCGRYCFSTNISTVCCIILSSIVAYRNGFPTIVHVMLFSVVFPMNVRGYCPSPMLLALRVLVSPCIVGYDIYSYFCGDW